MSFKIRTWNLAAERIYGWKVDEVMGKPIQEVIWGEYLDTTEKEALHQLQTAGVWHGETSHRRKDHSQVYLLASTSYVTDGAGKRVGVVSVNKDISERKHAQDELARYQNDLEQLVEQRTAELKRAKTRLEATLNNTTDGIVLAYPDRGVDQSNAMFNTLFACEPDHFCNQSLLMLVNPDDRDRLAALIQTVTADGVNRQGEFQALRADNTWFEARIGLGSIQDGDAIGAGLVCSIQDISELKQRERLLRYHASLQENVSDAVIATDLKFRIQSWNPAAEQIYGWRAEEVLGKLIGEILRTEFASDESGERMQRDFLEKGAWSDEVVQYHKEGHTLHILSSTVLFKDENGQPFGLVAVNHDITERKRTAEALALSEHRFSLLVNGISDYAIYMLDPAGNIISWNPGAQRIKGYSADEILGQHFSRFYTPEDLAQREPEKVLRIAGTEGHYVGEGWIVRKDGSKFWAETAVTALRDSENHLICFTKITRDLTEQKLAEEGLEQALAKEKELNELKSRFVSMVAHDFRSPLAAIQSSGDLLNNYSDRMTAEKKQHHFKTISSQILNLTGILEDTLTISKTEAVGLSLHRLPTDFVPFCQSIIDDMQLIDATRPIRLTVNGEVGTLEIDRDHMRRALVNLLSNAAKYSPEGCDIEFSIQGENEQVVIRIQDQGIGIPEADQSHLFEVFHRAGNVGDIPGT
ncbi:MAG: PAS domain S-box protein, partial [Chloroflexota bacterium]